VKSIPFKSYPSNSMGWLSIPLAVVMALAVYPLPSLGHNKGIYSSKADAEQRASEIGCTTVHENKVK